MNTPLLSTVLSVLGLSKVFGSSPSAYSSRLGKLSWSGSAAGPLMLGSANSLVVNLFVCQKPKVLVTVTGTEASAVSPLVSVTVTRQR